MKVIIWTPADKPVRVFPSTRMELAAEEHGYKHDDGSTSHRAWFVVDRRIGETDWHTHCGPYSEREQAIEWIQAIREVR